MVGLHLLRRSCFLPLTKKRRETALPPEEGEGLQDAVAGRPGEPPTRLCKALKIYPPLSYLRRPPPPPLVLPRAQEFPILPPKPPRALPKAKKDKEFFFFFETKALLKQTHAQYTGEGNGTPLQYSCLENPMDGGAW